MLFPEFLLFIGKIDFKLYNTRVFLQEEKVFVQKILVRRDFLQFSPKKFLKIDAYNMNNSTLLNLYNFDVIF